MTKQEARQSIREAAYRQRQDTNLRMAPRVFYANRRHPLLLPMPKLNQAVAIVRAKQLVDPAVLEAAGFNPTRSR